MQSRSFASRAVSQLFYKDWCVKCEMRSIPWVPKWSGLNRIVDILFVIGHTILGSSLLLHVCMCALLIQVISYHLSALSMSVVQKYSLLPLMDVPVRQLKVKNDATKQKDENKEYY